MKQYYYADNDQQLGPFTVEELKSKRLKKSTLAWVEGMEDWAKASDIEELKDILISEPPPLPKKTTTALPKIETIQIRETPAPIISTKFDLTYAQRKDATIVGVILLVIPILMRLFGGIIFESEQSYLTYGWFIIISSIVIRIIVTFWVIKIAKRLNRNSTGWGWFSFFTPSIALIIIGQLRKIRLRIVLDGSLPTNQQGAILLEKAIQLYSDDRNSECIEILNKAIEIENKNFDCIKLRGLASYKMENYVQSKSDFENLIQNEILLSDANFYLGKLAIIDKDRELAVSYWLKASELKNKNAEEMLDFYYTFTGIYLLDDNDLKRKTNIYKYEQLTSIIRGKYIGGLPEVDKIKNLGSLNVHIQGYENGLYLELNKSFKTYYVAIAYYEIDNIVFKETEKRLEILLTDKNIVSFSYDQRSYSYKGLEILCNRFKKATGKNPDAATS